MPLRSDLAGSAGDSGIRRANLATFYVNGGGTLTRHTGSAADGGSSQTTRRATATSSRRHVASNIVSSVALFLGSQLAPDCGATSGDHTSREFKRDGKRTFFRHDYNWCGTERFVRFQVQKHSLRINVQRHSFSWHPRQALPPSSLTNPASGEIRPRANLGTGLRRFAGLPVE